jgi:hypothetical protein
VPQGRATLVIIEKSSAGGNLVKGWKKWASSSILASPLHLITVARATRRPLRACLPPRAVRASRARRARCGPHGRARGNRPAPAPSTSELASKGKAQGSLPAAPSGQGGFRASGAALYARRILPHLGNVSQTPAAPREQQPPLPIAATGLVASFKTQHATHAVAAAATAAAAMTQRATRAATADADTERADAAAAAAATDSSSSPPHTLHMVLPMQRFVWAVPSRFKGAGEHAARALIERPALPGSSALPRNTCIGLRVTFVGHFGNGFVENLTGRNVDLDRLLLHCRAAAYSRADVLGRRAREENEEARALLPAPTGGGGGGAADSAIGRSSRPPSKRAQKQQQLEEALSETRRVECVFAKQICPYANMLRAP